MTTLNQHILLLLLFLCCVTAGSSQLFAHSGGTDRKGGHWDHESGTYHFHHGRGPHQHPDGECPYSDRASIAPSSMSSHSSGKKESGGSGWIYVLAAAGLGGGGYLLGRFGKQQGDK